MTKVVFETDDLWTEEQITDILVPLKERFPELIVNAFAIPNKLGPVDALKVRYPWINFCIHGFEHTHYECGEWTTNKAKYFIQKSIDLGYEPIFKAPNYYFDDETARACFEKKVTLVLSPNDSSKVNLVYPSALCTPHKRVTSHITRYKGTQDYIEDLPIFDKMLEHEGVEYVKIQDVLPQVVEVEDE